jgi:hypothetical protein
MGADSRYCKYNCDYMCAMCMEAERKDTNSSPKLPDAFNPLLDDDYDDVNPLSMGYPGLRDSFTDDNGDLVGFPLRRYDMVGNLITPPTGHVTPYVPPPMELLVKGNIYEVPVEKEVFPDSPDELVKERIVL